MVTRLRYGVTPVIPAPGSARVPLTRVSLLYFSRTIKEERIRWDRKHRIKGKGGGRKAESGGRKAKGEGRNPKKARPDPFLFCRLPPSAFRLPAASFQR